MNLGVINGVTTNQKILQKEGNKDVIKTVSNICKVVKNLPVNVELTKTSGTDKELLIEAISYAEISKNIVIKIPMWGDGRGLRLVREIREAGIPTNITCCMSASQAMLAAEAQSDYISLFFNRIADYYSQGFGEKNSYEIAKKTILNSRKYLEQEELNSWLIAGSIRAPVDVVSASISGAHVVTVPPKILEKMFYHPKTEETIKEFDNSWKVLSRR